MLFVFVTGVVLVVNVHVDVLFAVVFDARTPTPNLSILEHQPVFGTESHHTICPEQTVHGRVLRTLY